MTFSHAGPQPTPCGRDECRHLRRLLAQSCPLTDWDKAQDEIKRLRAAIGWLITEQAVTWYEGTVYGWENGIEIRKPAPPEVLAVLAEVDRAD